MYKDVCFLLYVTAMLNDTVQGVWLGSQISVIERKGCLRKKVNPFTKIWYFPIVRYLTLMLPLYRASSCDVFLQNEMYILYAECIVYLRTARRCLFLLEWQVAWDTLVSYQLFVFFLSRAETPQKCRIHLTVTKLTKFYKPNSCYSSEVTNENILSKNSVVG